MNQSMGTKRQCPECEAKFYDFGKTELVCPKCTYSWTMDAESTPEVVAPVAAAPVKTPVKKATLEDTDDMSKELGGVSALESFDDGDYEDFDHLEEVEDHHEEPEVSVDSDDAEDEMFIDELDEKGFHIIDELNDDGEMSAGSY